LGQKIFSGVWGSGSRYPPSPSGGKFAARRFSAALVERVCGNRSERRLVSPWAILNTGLGPLH
jgi:hypothetical protein